MSAAEYTIPTDPEELKIIENCIKTASDAKTIAEAARSTIAAQKKHLKEELGMPPGFFSRLLKTYTKRNFEQEQSEDENYHILYHRVFGDGSEE